MMRETRKTMAKINQSYRTGMTIVELLIVMGIMTLLAAVTLPAFRAAMTQRKVSQGAILVRNVCEAARSRAIATGRPTAVVLERLSSRAGQLPSGELVSITASSTDFASNYEVYNTSLRLSLAESPAPTMIEGVGCALAGYELTIGAAPADPRFTLELMSEPSLEFPEIPAINRPLKVLGWEVSAGTYDTMATWTGNYPVTLVVDNFGAANTPFYSTSDPAAFSPLVRLAKGQVFKPQVPDVGTVITSVVMHLPPRPISSQVFDMPRGTCVDLSLSGLQKDNHAITRGAAAGVINRRDLRRLFASDWSFANAAAPPSPEQLRPVYLVFNPTGSLQSVMTNDFAGIAGAATTREFTTLDDVYLFIGRTGQITALSDAVAGDVDPDVLADNREVGNINDTTCNWLRISPRSGRISVASVNPFNSYPFDGTATVTATTPIGQLLYQSRVASFTTEATAQ